MFKYQNAAQKIYQLSEDSSALLDAPVPIVIGINSKDLTKYPEVKNNPDLIIYDLDNNNFRIQNKSLELNI